MSEFLRNLCFKVESPQAFSRWTHNNHPDASQFYPIRTALRVQFSRKFWLICLNEEHLSYPKFAIGFCWFNFRPGNRSPNQQNQINKIKDLIFDLVNRTMQKIMYEVGGDLRSNLTITFANEPEWTFMAMIQIPYNSHSLQKTSVLRSFEMDWNGYLYITRHWIIWILER